MTNEQVERLISALENIAEYLHDIQADIDRVVRVSGRDENVDDWAVVTRPVE